MTYQTTVTLNGVNDLEIDYEIFNGEPSFTEEEKDWIVEAVVVALMESKEFKDNLSSDAQDIEDGRGDYEYDKRKDEMAECKYDIED